MLKSYYQPRNFRHSLSEPEGCTPRESLKPQMRCGLGIQASQQQSAATGPISTKTGNNFINGGSNGISMTVILIVVGVAAAVLFFFIREKKK